MFIKAKELSKAIEKCREIRANFTRSQDYSNGLDASLITLINIAETLLNHGNITVHNPIHAIEDRDCPKCDSPIVQREVGYQCVECGYIEVDR